MLYNLNSLEENLLKRFSHERQFSKLSSSEEEKTFQELQHYNLIKITAEGKIKTTTRGEEALAVGVRSYLVNQRLQEKLLNDSFRGKGEKSLFSITFISLLFFVGFIIGMLLATLIEL